MKTSHKSNALLAPYPELNRWEIDEAARYFVVEVTAEHPHIISQHLTEQAAKGQLNRMGRFPRLKVLDISEAVTAEERLSLLGLRGDL